ncbi:proliferating-cell nucleolar antigen p120, putative [Entamoeba histolytica KU27]|uniref:Proliferating-cell nucleolar antigen p120, putative n=1 Tax=Entamoeba histolytica KU27 TaxID=885311 RepID=M2PZS9_ENTHI|nr:proliferating-cell nucleolar antigen p120, putative [Entamoeba histolytica KU27]
MKRTSQDNKVKKSDISQDIVEDIKKVETTEEVKESLPTENIKNNEEKEEHKLDEKEEHKLDEKEEHNSEEKVKEESAEELFPSGDEDIKDEFSEEETPFEQNAKKTNLKEAKIKAEAAEEMQTNIAAEQRHTLPSGQEIIHAQEIGDVATIGTRIREIVAVLCDFKARHEEGRSRQEYISLLIQDMQTYYSCNEFLATLVVDLFGPKGAVDFMEANEAPRPVTIRVNTLKSRRRELAQKLINRGVNVDMIEWSKSGLVVYDSQVPIGATPEYLAGQYILQSSSSWVSVIALAPQPNEKILDMCAAPGGKTTHIAALMKDTGVLVANDISKDRLKAVIGNVHRLGITNTIITNCDGHEFPKVMGQFDRVLVDAPCTGLGIISRDAAVKLSKSEQDIKDCTRIQKELILHAIDSVNPKSKTGGYVVYSTCSITVEENEAVIDYALKKRNVKVVPIALQDGVGEDGYVNHRQYRFHPSVKMAKRFFPHIQNMDGFFVCKLKVNVTH